MRAAGRSRAARGGSRTSRAWRAWRAREADAHGPISPQPPRLARALASLLLRGDAARGDRRRPRSGVRRSDRRQASGPRAARRLLLAPDARLNRGGAARHAEQRAMPLVGSLRFAVCRSIYRSVLRVLRRSPGYAADRDPVARHRHRRQHRDLQRRPATAPDAAAGRASGRSAARLLDAATRRTARHREHQRRAHSRTLRHELPQQLHLSAVHRDAARGRRLGRSRRRTIFLDASPSSAEGRRAGGDVRHAGLRQFLQDGPAAASRSAAD